MTTFLFWNINNKPLHRQVRELADEHAVDVLVLAECNLSEATLLNALNTGKAADFHFTRSECPALKNIHPLRGRLPGGSFPRHPRIHSSHAASGARRDAVGDRPLAE